ncbi:recoverin isoform X2 [Eurytemora carolleeae]|uniref:recoverin isoform X2 n=1 Tax=Eurytemora carolleeae TaxID=1294199 RepID=UPI000C785CAC|nr:recoverin isoform X2 [Eurytemora carolleeae]|eukprot:XP_023345502.1 recoverin-like isoform X2 [Eurytemora affinis]
MPWRRFRLMSFQVREYFDSFVAEHPNGKMKKKDFRDMMSKALPEKDASKMEPHIFRIFDSNNDGFIDFVEFIVVFYILSDGSPYEVLEKIFRVFDVNWNIARMGGNGAEDMQLEV